MGSARTKKGAYDAPFPDESFRSGARMFPLLIPTSSGHPSAPFSQELFAGPAQACKVPLLTAFGSLDNITIMAEPVLQAVFQGAAGLPHRRIEGAGHFIQEHAPAACVQAILDLREQIA